jgi:hypothetical protein
LFKESFPCLSESVAVLLLLTWVGATTVTHAGDNKLMDTQASEWELTDWINSKAYQTMQGKVAELLKEK